MRMQLSPGFLLMALGLCACAGPRSSGATGGTPSKGAVTLEVRAMTEGGSGWKEVASGQALGADERFTLRVSLDEPAYLRVSRWSPKQKDDALYDARAPAGTTLLPEQGGYYKLSGPQGDEVLCVVASRRQLGAPEIADVLQRLALDRDPPPGQVDPKSRGDDAVVRMKMDGRGIAALRFRLGRR